MATNNSANYNPTNHALQVGGTNGSLTSLSVASTGKVLQSQGASADPDYSTATYPSTATGTGTILRADGTNWVATTATYPDTAGTSGNVLTSDGTNWTSSAPSAGYSGLIQINNWGDWNPADSTTYNMLNQETLVTASTSDISHMMIAKTATITKCSGLITIAGTLGSNENVTVAIRVNGGSSTNVTTTWQWNAASSSFNVSGLSIAVTAGDYIQLRVTTPAWATNPTSCNATYAILLT